MAVFLARMVIPRSRSSSFESITRSTWCSLERKVPLCCSMASTSVVLPWSTCAMMAILRILKLKVCFVLYWPAWIDSRTRPFLGCGSMYHFTMGGGFSADYIALTCKRIGMIIKNETASARGSLLFWRRSSCKARLHLPHRALRRQNARVGGRHRTFRIGIGEKHAIHGAPHQRLDLGIKSRSRHIHWMSAPVNMNFNGIDIRFRHQLLKIPQHSLSDSPCAILG